MINVGLITSWGTRCGITAYAGNLLDNLHDPDISVKVIPYSIAQAGAYIRDCQIVQVNECGYVMAGFREEQLTSMRNQGKKLLLTMHASNPTDNRNGFTQLFDAIVIHEKHTTDGFCYVPQGIPCFPSTVSIQPDLNYVGTNGFPMAHKNYLKLAEAAKAVGLHMSAMTPDSGHADAKRFRTDAMALDNACKVNTEWLTHEQIVNNLAACGMVCYAYTNSTPGPSASAMCGVSAQRPLILSRCTQFQHLFDYEDEIYFIESNQPTITEIARVLQRVLDDRAAGTVRIPHRVLADHSWDAAAKTYARIYKDMVA